MKFELNYTLKTVGIEPLVVGKEGWPRAERQNEPFAVFGRRECMGAQEAKSHELIEMAAKLLAQNLGAVF